MLEAMSRCPIHCCNVRMSMPSCRCLVAYVWRVCRVPDYAELNLSKARISSTWTKPLRGRNPHDVQFVTSGIHLVSLLRLVPQQASFAEPWSRCLQLIPSDRGA